MEENGVTRENHLPATSHWQTSSNNVLSSISISHHWWGIGRNKSTHPVPSKHMDTLGSCPMIIYACYIQHVFSMFKHWFCWKYQYKGNAKHGVSPRLKIRTCDLDLWPWKSIGFQILLRSKYVPSLVKIHWRMLILVFTRMLRCKNLTRWHWSLTYDLENQ